MMRWIVRSSLKFRFLLVAMAGGLLFFGVAKLFHTPVDVFPEFAPPRVEILFKLGTDLLQDRQLVQERLASVVPTLPTWAAPPVMMPPVSATSRIMKIGMTSKS